MNVKMGTTSEIGCEQGLPKNIDFNDKEESATKSPSECSEEIDERDESLSYDVMCRDGDIAITNNAAVTVGWTPKMSIASQAQDTPRDFPVREVIMKEQQPRHRFSQTLSDTLDSSDEEFVSDRIDETTKGAIDQIVNEDMNQLGAKQCDIVSSFESSRSVSGTSEREPSQKESLSDVYSVERVHELYRLCMETKPDENGITEPSKWEPVRNFLLSSVDLVQIAARIQCPRGLTPFHQICRHNPPLDIVELFIANAGLEIMSCTDKAGLLPLHYACAHNSSDDVIEALVQLYPESRLKQDTKGETPLHYAVTNMNLSVDAIDKVCIRGSAAAADHLGMLPFHYAIMYKACFNLSTVKVLVNAFPEGLACPDRRGRIPIRSLVNDCHLPETLDLVEFAIALDPALCKGDMGLMLLKNLDDCARRVGKSDNIQILLNLILEHNLAAPSNSFLAALQDLPRWLKKGDKYTKKSVLQNCMPRLRNIH